MSTTIQVQSDTGVTAQVVTATPFVAEVSTPVPAVVEVMGGLFGPAGATGAPGATGAAGQGVPVGGASGQVLAKNSSTNFDTGWVTPSAGGGSSIKFNVKDYGALGDGATDDYAAIVAAIAAIEALRALLTTSGTLYFPAGVYMTSAGIVAKTHMHIRGDGRGATTLVKNFSGGILLDISGSGTSSDGSTHIREVSVRDIKLEGNGNTGTVLRTYFASELYFQNVMIVGGNGTGLDAVELFDSYFSQCAWEDFVSTTVPVIWLRSSAATSGFANGIDSVNMVWFDQCRIESIKNSAFVVQPGLGAGVNGAPNGIFINQFKIECSNVRADLVVVDSAVMNFQLNQFYIYAGAFDSGFSTPINLLNIGSHAGTSITNGMLACAAGIVDIGLTIASADGSAEVNNVTFAGTPVTSAFHKTGSGPVKWGAVSTTAGTLFSGSEINSVHQTAASFHNQDTTNNPVGLHVLNDGSGADAVFENSANDANMNVTTTGTSKAAFLNLFATAAAYNAISGWVSGALKWRIGRSGDSDGVSVYTLDGNTKAAQFHDDLSTALFGPLTVHGASGVLTVSATSDGGDYNIGVDTTGVLALFGAGGQSLNVKLLDGYLELDALTATTVPYLDSNKRFVSSAVTPTELGYLSGVSSALQTQLGNKQPLDSDLTTIAGLTATTDNFIVSVASAWASRTPAQVKTTLALNNVENTALSTWAGSSNLTTLGALAVDLTISTHNIITDTSTGTKIGTATTQKLGFFNATPIVQPSNTTDLRAALINLGLYASGGATPLDLNAGVLTTGNILPAAASTQNIGSSSFRYNTVWAGALNLSFASALTLAGGSNFVLDATTGTKIGTATTQKLGFYNSTPIVQEGATVDLGTVLSDLGLRAAGTAYPITTSGAITFSGGAVNISGGVTGAGSIGITTVAGQNAEIWMGQATGATLKIKAQDVQSRLTSTLPIMIDSDDAGTNLAIFGASGSKIKAAAGTTAIAPLVITHGINLTTAAVDAIENDAIGMYLTTNTTDGRAHIPARQHFRLTSDGSNITTIANFFGTTSNISLVASAYYEIEIVCWFTKTTSEALTWTFTNSAAPTSMNIHVEQSPITGVVTTAASYLGADIVASTTAAQTYVTGSLTTAVKHFAKFRITLKNGSGTSLKIQATNPAGSITPLLGSYWTAVRIPTGNTGSFAA